VDNVNTPFPTKPFRGVPGIDGVHITAQNTVIDQGKNEIQGAKNFSETSDSS